jgi:hypothetical protein
VLRVGTQNALQLSFLATQPVVCRQLQIAFFVSALLAVELICGVVFPFRVLTHRKCAAGRYSKRLAAELPRNATRGLQTVADRVFRFGVAGCGAHLRRCFLRFGPHTREVREVRTAAHFPCVRTRCGKVTPKWNEPSEGLGVGTMSTVASNADKACVFDADRLGCARRRSAGNYAIFSRPSVSSSRSE